jgi:hypothetical protein
MEKLRPCGTCHFTYEEHKVYMDMGNIFCPDQDLMDGPAEAFDCYKPCGNLQYLEWLDKQRKESHG